MKAPVPGLFPESTQCILCQAISASHFTHYVSQCLDTTLFFIQHYSQSLHRVILHEFQCLKPVCWEMCVPSTAAGFGLLP